MNILCDLDTKEVNKWIKKKTVEKKNSNKISNVFF